MDKEQRQKEAGGHSQRTRRPGQESAEMEGRGQMGRKKEKGTKTEAQKRRSHREQKFRGAQIFRAETKHQRAQDRGIRNNLVGRAGRQRTGNI